MDRLPQQTQEQRDALEKRILTFLADTGNKATFTGIKDGIAFDGPDSRRWLDNALQRLRKQGAISFTAPFWSIKEDEAAKDSRDCA